MSSTFTPVSGTNIGPLTTTYTQPAACSVAIVECPYSCALGYQGQQCISSIPGGGCQDATSCWPGATSTVTPTYPLLGWGYYSPGTLCPTGYISACSATAGGSTGWDMQFALSASETAVGCCPSGFGCQLYGGVQSCYSTASSSASVAVGTCTQGTTEAFSFLTLPAPVTEVVKSSGFAASTEVVSGLQTFAVAAPLFEIRWQASDRPSSASSIATSSSTSTATSTASSSPATSGGLSSGAKIAIGVIVPVIVLLAFVGAFLVWRRRRNRGAWGQPHLSDMNGEVKDSRLLDKDDVGSPAPAYSDRSKEPEDHELQELPGEQRETYELADNRPPAELAGSKG